MSEQYHQPSLFELEESTAKSVECLGMTFVNDAERRSYFLDKLREKLKDPEFRKIEGFPIGGDEQILAMSDPPYYTACPNPFLEDFIKQYGKPYDSETDDYKREPFAADVSEGKNDPIYNAHAYHTKVPHKAIMRYILHYTEPGDIVFDGFCGTGMTGVAAQLCGDRSAIESLGYTVQKDGTILDKDSQPFSKIGARRAVLNDLSPFATFIAYNYNMPRDVAEFERETKRIHAEVEKECGWMYLTLHQPKIQQIEKATSFFQTAHSKIKSQHPELPWGRINYTVWSDVFSCPECAGEVVFWEAAVDKNVGEVLDKFFCPHCNAQLTKRNMDRVWVTQFDTAINQTIRQAKQMPVLINYSVGKKRFEKVPDRFDLELIKNTENSLITYCFSTSHLPKGYNTEQPKGSHGITHVHHFYTKRNLGCLSALLSKNSSLKSLVTLTILDGHSVTTKMSRFRVPAWVNKTTGPMKGLTSGTLYIPSLSGEQNCLNVFLEKSQMIIRSLRSFQKSKETAYIQTASATQIDDLSRGVDYIFLDPPFGGNLMYSELNFILESWLKTFTNNQTEAIENKSQGKTLDNYRRLMTDCFKTAYHALKPGRWMTVEFSNTQASVWNAIQTALQEAGFVVANVSALDKKQGSFKAVTTTTAVKQDLVISAYKPSNILEDNLTEKEDMGVWEFLRNHLENLPRVKSNRGQLEFIAERDPRILYDRMIAFFFQRGYSLPLSSQEFQEGLRQRFAERDGMFFLPEQIAEYDCKRLQIAQVPQLELFVFDERTAIDWLHNFLKHRPSTYQDIQPEFLKQLSASWRKYETRPELLELLKANFLCYDGKGEVPSQISACLLNNFPELQSLSQNELVLMARAKERWYVPDPNKAGDLEKLRERELLKQFETYKQPKQKQIKELRIEAIRAGFKKAWQEKDYQTIVDVAEKISGNILQEDEKLLFFYDMAVTRLGED